MDVEDTTPAPERKQRKSVAFTDEQVVVDADGSVTMVNATEEPKETAQSHTPRTPPLTAALEALHADANSQAGAEDATAPVPDAAAGEDGGLDLSIKKKKKKTKVPKDGDEDEFTAKLKALELEGKEEGAEAEGAADDGDMDQGTGIWQHDETKALSYSLLLNRFFHQLSQKNPDHALSGSKSYKIPPPQCMREGNKKTIFANIAEICKRMKRTEEHVTAYLFSELGTSGSVDGSRRLVIKGRFQQKQLENVLRKYISKSADTELSKGENRLYFITCNSCGSRRSVTAIKTGFSAQIGKRRKMQG
ncbi:domain found in IF2B/IF5-domain-containing protein [Colletotrichum lupini]|nr:domain found in IF2B/IF5-domain-containing protein [Colletotrichum lupini]